MTVFHRTSRLRSHAFRPHEFWEPFCSLCHEKRHHPIHRRKRGEYEVCGYDPCSFCGEVSDPHRGVPH